VGREVHDGVDPVVRQHRGDPLAVAGVADHQLAGRDGLREAGAQVVQGDDPLAGGPELPQYVAADVPGPSGDQDRSLHAVLSGTMAPDDNSGGPAARSVVVVTRGLPAGPGTSIMPRPLRRPARLFLAPAPGAAT
jgi:hypothetical protein